MINKGLIAVAIILTIGLTFGSCKKDSNGNPISIPSMSATISDAAQGDTLSAINPTPWAAVYPFAVLKSNFLTINGTALNLDGVTLTVYGLTPGTYKLGLGVLSAQCGAVLNTKQVFPDSLDVNGKPVSKFVIYTSTSGEVTLSKVDTESKLVSGTFEFTTFSGGLYKTITQGQFDNVAY